MYISICFYQASPNQHLSDIYPQCKVSPTRLQRGFLPANRASSVSETGEVSIPLPRPQIKTQILAEIIQVPAGTANLSAVPGYSCLPQGGQSVSLWSQADANVGRSRSTTRQSCCSSCADGLPHWGNMDYLGQISSSSVLDYQSYICDLPIKRFLLDLMPWIKHPQLFGISWQQGDNTNWGRPHLFHLFWLRYSTGCPVGSIGYIFRPQLWTIVDIFWLINLGNNDTVQLKSILSF